jgi:chromate transport protein ChrA
MLAGAASTGTASALWAIVRTAVATHAQWIDVLCALVLLLACVVYLNIRWLLCAVCLLGVLFLQNRELDQRALHQHGRTEHVRVRQIR